MDERGCSCICSRRQTGRSEGGLGATVTIVGGRSRAETAASGNLTRHIQKKITTFWHTRVFLEAAYASG